MKIIKNAIVYKAELPRAELLADHLLELEFAPITELQAMRAGFVPNGATGELLNKINGGLSLSVRYDEKILPKASVKAAIAEAVEDRECDLGRDLTKEELGAVAEEITAALIAKALVKTTHVNAFYDESEQFLIVATTNKKMADMVVGMLVKVCGSVKTSTIHINNIKGGLTTRLTSYLHGNQEAFEGFALGDSCLLKDGTNRASFDLDNLDHASQGITEAIDGEMQVERIELSHGEVCFKLTKDFHFRGINFFGEMTEEELERIEDFDSAEIWRMEASTQMIQLSAAIKMLCTLLGYKEPEEPTAEETLPDDAEDEIYLDAVAFVRKSGRASISAVQRNFSIGYNRAARLIERMEVEGIVTSIGDDGSRAVI